MSLDQTPKCPNCGKRMVLRTAKNGPFAGKSFYGCPSYPNCKGIVDASETLEPTQVQVQANQNRPNTGLTNSIIKLPKFSKRDKRIIDTKFITITPQDSRKQTRVFQTIYALPKIATHLNVNWEQISHNINAFTQWRLDYPINDSTFNKNNTYITTVLDKIMLRGTITFCSPGVEEEILSRFEENSDEIDKSIEYIQDVNRLPRSYSCTEYFDSIEEKKFFTEFLSLFTSPQEIRPWLSTQMMMSSISNNTDNQLTNQRVDFFINMPDYCKVIFEIDGPQHTSQIDSDKHRDNILTEAGYSVFRIPTDHLNHKKWMNSKEIRKVIADLNNIGLYRLSEHPILEKLLYIKAASQFQITMLEAIKNNTLFIQSDCSWKIKVIPPNWANNQKLWKDIIKVALADFLELVENTYKFQTNSSIKIHAELVSKNSPAPDLIITYTYPKSEEIITDQIFSISDISLPIKVQNNLPSCDSLQIVSPNKTSTEFFLNYIFRKKSFLEGQWEGIARTIQGKDTILLLPTGGGKSIAFQLASFLLPGVCLVIDPLISLIEDQIDNLSRYGIDRCVGITSQLSSREKQISLDLLSKGNYLICYVAPERFQMKDFRQALRGLTVYSPICLIAIDETHCVSEWGHDFRVSYLNIARNARFYCKKNDQTPPLLGLTGTASRSVLRDVRRELEITDYESVITPNSFDRDELSFSIYECRSNEKNERLLGILNSLPTKFGVSQNIFFSSNGESSKTGLIFYPHVNGQYGVVNGYDLISKSIGVDVGIYSGKPPKNSGAINWDDTKAIFAEKFKNNELTVLTCTNAFGMGIDKPNIRYTIHMNIPSSIEAFYQEAGRAGRDHKSAICSLIVSNDYPKRSKKLLDPSTPLEEIEYEIKSLDYSQEDDITRAMFFHVNAFRGANEELRFVKNLIEEIGDLESELNLKIGFDEETRVMKEKAVHRLVILGVILDYTIDYSKNEIEILTTGADSDSNLSSYLNYLSNYDKKVAKQAGRIASEKINLPHKDFILFLAEKLIIDFIYNILELSRRRSLNEMLQACITDPTDKGIRSRVLSYLQLSHYAEILDEARENPDDLLQIIEKLAEEVDSPLEAGELRGQTARMLEAYPNNPAFLLLRAFAEVNCPDKNVEVICENFKAYLRFSLSPTGWGNSNEDVIKDSIWFFYHVSNSDPWIAQLLQVILMETFSDDTDVARKVISENGLVESLYPKYLLLSKVNERIKKIL